VPLKPRLGLSWNVLERLRHHPQSREPFLDLFDAARFGPLLNLVGMNRDRLTLPEMPWLHVLMRKEKPFKVGHLQLIGSEHNLVPVEAMFAFNQQYR